MFSRIASIPVALGVSCLLAACTSPTEAPAAATAPRVMPFVPSNVALSEIDFAEAGDVVISTDGCGIDTDNGAIGCTTGGKAAFKVLAQPTLPGAVPLAVFVVRSFRLESGVRLSVRGRNALVIISQEDVVIAGSVLVNSTSRDTVAGGFTNTRIDSSGEGPGGGGAGQVSTSAAGASFCGTGGSGTGVEGAPPAKAGAVYGDASLVPLMPGSSGGQGTVGQAGGGGGAVQISAGGALTVGARGVIHAGGGGGAPGGGAPGQNASGGGSGGAILLESMAVAIDGTLAANGGGGGQGALFAYGADASADAAAASGANKDGAGTSIGGDGGAGATLDGTAGRVSTGMTAGAGGGGAGRIRINTHVGAPAFGPAAVLSPAPAGASCTTFGNVTP
jgi:hypothetical protein